MAALHVLNWELYVVPVKGPCLQHALHTLLETVLQDIE